MAFKKRIRGLDLLKTKTEFRFLKTKIPLRLANKAQNHFLKGFRQGGGQTDASAGGWKPRKRSRSARERKRSVGRAILVRSGKLRADIKKRKVSFSQIRVGTRSIPYAEFVNDGTPRMAQREFIGDSKVLEKEINGILKQELDKMFKI
jgi:phage gpG-like protein